MVATAVVAGSLGLAFSSSAGAGQAAPRPAPTDAPVLARARTFARAFARRSAAGVRHAEWVGSLGVTDAIDDVADPRADIEVVQVTFTSSALRVAVTTAAGSDPTRDPAWTVDGSGIGWGIDTTGDGKVDALAIMMSTPTGRLGGVVVDANASAVRCLAAASWDGPRTYSLTFPPSCVHASSSVNFGAFMSYGTTTMSSDVASWSLLAGPVTPMSAPTGAAGALVLDAWGGLHFTGVGSARTSPGVAGSPYWKGWDIARGVAVVPGGGYGLVVDGFGGLHGFALGRDAPPGPPAVSAYWVGRDVARGVAVLADGTGGFVLDMSGGLHWFSIGDGTHSPKLSGVPSWPGADVARGVALAPNGAGGWIVDLYGGLHWFSIGAPHAAPAVFGAPYWRGWDIARGASVLPDGSGGYVVDAWGGLHWFSIGAKRTAPLLTGAPYWKGWQVARGVATIPAAPALVPGPPAPTPTTTTSTTTTTTTTATTPVSGPNGTLVPIGGTLQDEVVDAAGQYAYVTNSSANVVDVLDLQSRTFVAAIPVGSAPMGLDLTPDGTELYVANSGGNNLSVVDVASRTEVRKITVPPQQYTNDTPYSLVIVGDKVLFTTTFAGSGFGGRMMQMDLATDALSQRSDTWPNGQTTEATTLARSADRSTALMVEGDNSGGEVQRYDVATDSFGTMHSLSTFVTGAALDGDGSTMVVDGRFVLDPSLNVTGTITGSGPAVLNAAGTTGYRTQVGGLQLFDLAHFLTGTTLLLPDTTTAAANNRGGGRVALTPDGSTVAVITDHGVSIRSTS